MSAFTETQKTQASHLNIEDPTQVRDAVDSIVIWTNAVVSNFEQLSSDEQKNLKSQNEYQFCKNIQAMYPKYASTLDIQPVNSSSSSGSSGNKR